MYPLSDHYDGRKFFNPGAERSPRGFGQVLRWRLTSRRSRWPEAVVDPAYPPGPDVVPDGSVAITHVNHASFLIRFPGVVVLTDPIFSPRCSPVPWAGPKRVRPPGVALDALPRPDVVLVSHNHYDHLDLPTLRALQQRHGPRFVTPLGNARLLRRAGIEAIELDWWEDTAWTGLRIVATPARHFSARTPWDRNQALWASFMLETGQGRVFFAGDSAAGGHWADIRTRVGAPEVALLPIGAYEPRWFMAAAHMNPHEAVRAHRDLGAARSVGMHFGTFQLTDEAIDAPLMALDEARLAGGVGLDEFVTQGFGETRVFPLGWPIRP